MILLGPEAKKISDLVVKVRFICPWILDSDKVEVYQDKYQLPPDEEIGLINTQEDVIIIPISISNDVVVKREYVETDVKPEGDVDSACISTQNGSKKERSSKTDVDIDGKIENKSRTFNQNPKPMKQ